jgi:serine/threonine-protein kinase RsbW
MNDTDDPEKSAPQNGAVSASRPGGESSWVIEDVAAVRPSLMVDETATAQNIARVRREFATWLAVDLAAGDLLDDLILAVYEALANVSDHAYTDTPAGVGALQLTAHRAHESLRITISDRGRWRPTTNAPFRNRGLPLIRQLIAQVHIETTASGTVVHLRTPLPAPAGPAPSGAPDVQRSAPRADS